MTKYKALEDVTLADGTAYTKDAEFEVEATEELSQLVAAGKLVVVEATASEGGEGAAQ